MKHLVEFKLEDGSAIMVEVEAREAEGGAIRAGRKPGEIYYMRPLRRLSKRWIRSRRPLRRRYRSYVT